MAGHFNAPFTLKWPKEFVAIPFYFWSTRAFSPPESALKTQSVLPMEHQ
jgi:hypothetical protein